MGAEFWKVIGGTSKGGLLVREKRELSSPEVPGRLAPGAVVKQVALDGERLQYERLAGDGPPTGWVTLRTSAGELLVKAPEDEVAGLLRRGAVETSRQRIGDADGKWQMVLNVPDSASVEDVRRSFHELALLHHPDKNPDASDGGELFRCVQKAYEAGLAEVSRKTHSEKPLEIVEAGNPSLPVSLTAPRAALRKACETFEDLVDQGTSTAVPDDIPYVLLEQVLEWLREGSCTLIDTREPEDKYGASVRPMPTGIPVSYTRLLKSPDTLVPELARLQGHADRGQRLVSYSTLGSSSNGNCAMVCCLLVDVFGFKIESFHCLEEGYGRWRRWMSQNGDAAERLYSKYSAQ